jgi:hypothetical protein
MEIVRSLRQVEGSLGIICDRVAVQSARLDDLLFRAQRIAMNVKNGHKNPDMMYGSDLQHFRQEIRRFGFEIAALPNQVGAIERIASFSEESLKPAQSLMRVCERLSREVKSLHDKAILAHQHMREAEYKIEAWYLIQDIQEMIQRAQSLPNAANRIVLRVSSP